MIKTLLEARSPFEEDVLRLEVAVDDAALTQHRQRVEDLLAEEAHQVHGQAPELVLLDELKPARAGNFRMRGTLGLCAASVVSKQAFTG
jgi:hypothetical protein